MTFQSCVISLKSAVYQGLPKRTLLLLAVLELSSLVFLLVRSWVIIIVILNDRVCICFSIGAP